MAGQPKRLQERPAHPATCASLLRLDTPALQVVPPTSPLEQPAFSRCPNSRGIHKHLTYKPSHTRGLMVNLGLPRDASCPKPISSVSWLTHRLFNNLPSSPRMEVKTARHAGQGEKEEAAMPDSGVASLISKELTTACRALPRGADLRPHLPEL